MYCYDYRISLRVQHPTEAGAGIAARLDLEPAFSRDVGTGYRDRDGSLISGHAETRVVFVLERGKDGWVMDAWPALVDLLRARADVIGELLQEGHRSACVSASLERPHGRVLCWISSCCD